MAAFPLIKRYFSSRGRMPRLFYLWQRLLMLKPLFFRRERGQTKRINGLNKHSEISHLSALRFPIVLPHKPKKLSHLEAALELSLSHNNLQCCSHLDGPRTFNEEEGGTLKVSYKACLTANSSFIFFQAYIPGVRISQADSSQAQAGLGQVKP